MAARDASREPSRWSSALGRLTVPTGGLGWQAAVTNHANGAFYAILTSTVPVATAAVTVTVTVLILLAYAGWRPTQRPQSIRCRRLPHGQRARCSR